MKLNSKRFRRLPGSGGALRRRLHCRLFELQKAVEDVEEGMKTGCLPGALAAMLIGRIERRGAVRVGLGVSHVR